MEPGNTFLVSVTVNPGYMIENAVITPPEVSLSLIEDHATTNGDGSTTYYFEMVTMPDASLGVNIVLKKGYKATMEMVSGDNVGYAGTGTGWNEDGSLLFPTSVHGENEAFTGQVEVQPGWYIASIRVEGESTLTNYTDRLTYSGNGYNNGAGTNVDVDGDGVIDFLPVTLTILGQPAEDIKVYITLKEGPPDPDKYSLTLTVEDDGNSGDGNYAVITGVEVKDDPNLTRPHVTNGGSGGTVTSDTYSSLSIGQWVYIHADAAKDYVIDDAYVDPASLGTYMEWVDDNTLKVQQPGGNPTVKVKFVPKETRNHTVTLHISNIGAATGAGTATVTNTTVNPNTSINADGRSMPIQTGDDLDVQVIPGATDYVQVTIVTGGTTTIQSTTVAGTQVTDLFKALPGDAEVYVTFSDTPFEKPVLTLNVKGQVLTPPNQAELTVDGDLDGTVELTQTVDANEPTANSFTTTVAENGQVTVTLKHQTGYTANITFSEPSLSPTPTIDGNGNQVYTFPMPDVAQLIVDVEFVEGEPPQRTINVVPLLRLPNGTTVPIDTVNQGDAQFVDGTGTQLGYSMVAPVGTALQIDAVARYGYVIDQITADVGIIFVQSGTLANTTVSLSMPNIDNGTVYVYFKESWPDEGEVTLKVIDNNADTPADDHAQLTDTATGTKTGDLYTAITGGSASETIVTADTHQLRVDVWGIDATTKATEVITDWAGNVLTAGIDYTWNTDATGTYILVDMRAPIMTVELTFEPKGPEDRLKATLSYDDTTGGVVEIVSGTLTAVSSNGQFLEPLYTADKVDVTITPPAGKVPVLQVTGDTTGAVHTYVPDPMTETAGVYTTAFTMQNEDVTVKVLFTDAPDPDERFVKLTVQGPDHSGQAHLADPAGQTTTPDPVLAPDPANPGNNWGVMTATLGDTMTLTVTPSASFAVAAIKGVTVDGVDITITGQTGPNTYSFDIPATLAAGATVDVVVTFEEAKTDLRVDLVKNDPAPAPNGNVAWLESAFGTPDATDTTQPAGKRDIGITGLAPTDLVKVHVDIAIGYKAEVSIVGTGVVATFTASGTYDLYMPNADTLVYVEYMEDAIRYNITLDVVPGSDDSTYNAGNMAEIHTDYSGTAGPINGDDTPVTVKGEVNDVVTIQVKPQNGYYTRVTYTSDTDSVVRNLTADLLDESLYTFSVPKGNVTVKVEFIPDDVPKPEHDLTLHLMEEREVGGVPTYVVIDPTDVGSKYSGLLAELQRNLATWAGGSLKIDANPTLANPISAKVTMDEMVTVHAQATSDGTKLLDYVKAAYAEYGGVMLATVQPGGTIPGYQDVYDPAGSGTRISRDFTFKMQDGNVDVYIVLEDIDKAPPTPEYVAALTVEDETDPASATGTAGSATLSREALSAESVTVGSNDTTTANTVGMTANETLTVNVTAKPGYVLDRITVTDLGLGIKADLISETPQTDGSIDYVYEVKVPADIAQDIAVNVYLLGLNVGRPFDPYQSEWYNSPDYAHYGDKDLSEYHQEAGSWAGWQGIWMRT